MSSGSMRAKTEKLRRQIGAAARVMPRHPGRKRGPRLDPKERSWAHAYLKLVAEVHGYPYAGARQSMQDLASFFSLVIPAGKAGAGRSRVAIDLAKAIQLKTGIRMPDQQQDGRREQSDRDLHRSAGDQRVPS